MIKLWDAWVQVIWAIIKSKDWTGSTYIIGFLHVWNCGSTVPIPTFLRSESYRYNVFSEYTTHYNLKIDCQLGKSFLWFFFGHDGLRTLTCLKQCYMIVYCILDINQKSKKQKAHGPHRSNEKLVQINIYIWANLWLYIITLAHEFCRRSKVNIGPIV